MDLTKQSLKQLEKLASDIEKELSARAKKKIADARKAAEAAAKKHGYSLKELLGDAPGSKKGKAKSGLPAKYKDPSDPKKTWSGRGRQPDWYKKAIAAGKKPEDLAV